MRQLSYKLSISDSLKKFCIRDRCFIFVHIIPTPSVIESVCRGVKRAQRARFTPRQTATLQTDSVLIIFAGHIPHWLREIGGSATVASFFTLSHADLKARHSRSILKCWLPSGRICCAAQVRDAQEGGKAFGAIDYFLGRLCY